MFKDSDVGWALPTIRVSVEFQTFRYLRILYFSGDWRNSKISLEITMKSLKSRWWAVLRLRSATAHPTIDFGDLQ
jgi:hypothetical protein